MLVIMLLIVLASGDHDHDYEHEHDNDVRASLARSGKSLWVAVVVPTTLN